MRRYTRPTVPPAWECATTVRLRGRVVTPGMSVRVARRTLDGRTDRGTFTFTRHVVNTATGAQWIDVRDAHGGWRSFRPEDVRSIPRRQPVAAARAAAAREVVAA